MQRLLVIAFVGAVCGVVPAAAAAEIGDYRFGVPAYSPKASTPGIVEATNFTPEQRTIAARHYDLNGQLLGSFSFVVPGNGYGGHAIPGSLGTQSLQLLSDTNELAFTVFYTDPGSNARTVPPSDILYIGPAPATLSAVETGFATIRSPLDSLTGKVDSVNSTLPSLRTTPDARVASLQQEVSRTRKDIKSLRTLLQRALKRRK